ncbi:heme biosynthesis HemY N-terminal domain-containing protein [Aurantimonas sp. 22II-16-19i]|uniref:heme biosynthesis protein HemY n=1 Tax=Aurantimonas sp. 22II-16-19i TaxID=1317114 RepID=UPI0009F7C73D|nr:heme biosynthesis HemY N-terminal domain-containing protein [Aurantimonas sp. 22II-16-19i]ORE90018.1 HemY domain-containing protein [Aurantimonas sp. 22II-16-19i]
MLRILAFLLVVLALSLGFGWLADNPGSVTFDWQGQTVQTSMMIFLIALGIFVFAAIVLVWLISAFFRTPHTISNWVEGRRRDKGYSALSTGIIAAGAGDAILARRMTKRSQKLLDRRREPLIRFLDAQTAMIEGDHAHARSVFQSMESDPETRLLAMRGLYLEAERVGDEKAARFYAERAVRLAPHVPWAGGAVLDGKSIAGDWDGAMNVLEAQQNTRLIDRDESKRTRAVLLTGKAMDRVEADPKTAKAAALEAHNLAPELVPAALVAAQACFRLGDLRKGVKVLEKSWTYGPHPEVGEAYVAARPGDSVEDRLKRARHLASLRPGNVESALCLARAALDAGDLQLARKSALEAAEIEPRESVYLLLADIEEEDTGEVGRVREWMAKAIRAPRDPAWTADGVVSEHWAPVSPVSGRLDAFEWKSPPQRAIAAQAHVLDEAAQPTIDAEPSGAGDADGGRPGAAAPSGAANAGPTSSGADKADTRPAGETARPAATAAPAAGPSPKYLPDPSRPADAPGNGSVRPAAVKPPAQPGGTPAQPEFGRTSEERKEARFG